MPSSFSKSNATYVALAAGSAAATYAGTHAYKSRIQRKFDDGIDLKNQSVEIDPVEHIRRCTFYKDIDIYSFHKTILPHVQTLGDVFYHGYSVSNDGPCIGFYDPANDGALIRWITYSTAIDSIRRIGSHLWTNVQLTPTKSTVAIISLNRAEYSFVEHACYTYGFIVLALYTSYDQETVLSILDKTQTEVLVVDNLDRIDSFKDKLLERSYLKEILVMDNIVHNESSRIRSIPAVLQTVQQSDVRSRPYIDPDNVAAYILTSGTTG